MKLTSGKYIIRLRNRDICLSRQSTSGTQPVSYPYRPESYPYKLQLFGTVDESKLFPESNIFEVIVLNENNKVQIKSNNMLLRHVVIRYGYGVRVGPDVTVDYTGKSMSKETFLNFSGLVFSEKELSKYFKTNEAEVILEENTFYLEDNDGYYTLNTLILQKHGSDHISYEKRYMCALDDDLSEKSQLSFNMHSLYDGYAIDRRQCNRKIELEFIPVETFLDVLNPVLYRPTNIFIVFIIVFIIIVVLFSYNSIRRKS